MIEKFLQDVAQGVYGKSTLTYTEVGSFLQKATPGDLEEIKEFFWDWTSELTDEDDIDVSELETIIRETI